CIIKKPGEKSGSSCDYKSSVTGRSGNKYCCGNYPRVIRYKSSVSLGGNELVSCECVHPKGSSGGVRVVPLNEFRDQALQRHNELRAKLCRRPLKLSEDLNEYAQKWAEYLVSAHGMKHSKRTMKSGEKLGENIAQEEYNSLSGGVYRGESAVELWYSGIKNYNFTKGGEKDKASEFLQVISKRTAELGIGLVVVVVVSKAATVVVVVVSKAATVVVAAVALSVAIVVVVVLAEAAAAAVKTMTVIYTTLFPCKDIFYGGLY
ncbi:Golgi-associated plant pathogenesis-related protein 1, partial [Elysia marginata]